MKDKKYTVTKNQEEFTSEYQKLLDMETNTEKPSIQLGQWAQGRINAMEIRELSTLINFTLEECS